MKDNFLPLRDGDIDTFEESFESKISIYTSILGLNPAEITATKNIISVHRAAFSNMNSKKQESKSATEENSKTKELSMNELRRIAKLIKASKTYTETIGQDLGMVGSDKSTKETSELKPILKGKQNGNQIIIQFQKDGTDGIKIFSRRANETEFTFLAVDTQSPYTDSRAKLEEIKPEVREYFAFFFEKEDEIGQKSDILKIIIP